jgi:hypothetical protein
MKLIYKHKNIFMIFFLCLSFVLSLYIVYKEIVYFNNIENFENPNKVNKIYKIYKIVDF